MNKQIRFVEVVEAIAVQQDQIDRYGGDAGIRDRGLLESAMAMPRASLGGDYVHQGLIEMAGAYLFHLAKNYAFVDGNKRVALAVMVYFLDYNGRRLQAGHAEVEELVLNVASGTITKDQATAVLRRWIVSLDEAP